MARKSQTLYTVGTAPFKGGPATLRKYIRDGKLGDVARLPNNIPVLRPDQVARANKILDRS